MIDKINKLLDSKDLDNILVAIQLAYKLPIEDFEGLFVDHRFTGYQQQVNYKFRRNNKWYGMGRGAFIVRDYELKAPAFKDITPENYEGENT